MTGVQSVDSFALGPVLAVAAAMLLVLVLQAVLPVAAPWSPPHARPRRPRWSGNSGGAALAAQALQPGGFDVRRTFCAVAARA